MSAIVRVQDCFRQISRHSFGVTHDKPDYYRAALSFIWSILLFLPQNLLDESLLGRYSGATVTTIERAFAS